MTESWRERIGSMTQEAIWLKIVRVPLPHVYIHEIPATFRVPQKALFHLLSYLLLAVPMIFYTGVDGKMMSGAFEETVLHDFSEMLVKSLSLLKQPLAIAMWDSSWLRRQYCGGGFEDRDQ